MTAIASPIGHAMAQAQAWLTDQGDEVPHYLGEAARSLNADAPRYVWVPTRTRERGDTDVRPIDEARSLAVQQEHVEIDCWGRDDAEAWAMRCNVWNALHAAFAADLMFEDGQWVRPGAALTQRGELYRLEVSILVPIAEGYIALAGLEAPAPELFTVEGFEGWIHRSPDTDTDGELGLTVDSD